MVKKLSSPTGYVWMKHYAASVWPRKWLCWMWNWLVLRLEIRVLLSPTHYAGEAGQRMERRRLQQLAELGAPVPRILGEGQGVLLLSDMGRTLSSQLKRAHQQDDQDLMISDVAASLAQVHRTGGYLGQAVPRNITVTGKRVGFIDFEEDPGEVMTLQEAQARDWILFVHGVARYYVGRSDVLVLILRKQNHRLDADMRKLVTHAAKRLRFLRTGWLPDLRRLRPFAITVLVMQQAF